MLRLPRLPAGVLYAWTRPKWTRTTLALCFPIVGLPVPPCRRVYRGWPPSRRIGAGRPTPLLQPHPKMVLRQEGWRMTRVTQFAFSVGGAPAQVSATIISFFLTPFLLETVGLRANYVAFIMMIGRLCDAVSDPAVGFLSDHTVSRFGRRRPVRGVPPPAEATAAILPSWCLTSYRDRFVHSGSWARSCPCASRTSAYSSRPGSSAFPLNRRGRASPTTARSVRSSR